jgi:dethiobiotin synthase
MRYFVTGTDTDVGKTVVAAWLMLRLGADYWKPVQAGREGGTDRERVQALTGLPAQRFHPSAYELREPLSPHEAARREGIRIGLDRLEPPQTSRPLVIEGAGGLLVPLNDEVVVVDLIARLGAPVILVARSTLGTINHTLLSLEALRRRDIPVAGVVINGPVVPHNRSALEFYGRLPIIAEIPPLAPLTRDRLLGIRPSIDLTSGEQQQ